MEKKRLAMDIAIEKIDKKITHYRECRDSHKSRSISFKLYVEKIVTLLDQRKELVELRETEKENIVEAYATTMSGGIKPEFRLKYAEENFTKTFE